MPSPSAKPPGSSSVTSAIGSPVFIEMSSSHSFCCAGGTTFPPNTARIQRSTSRALDTAPPADCIHDTLLSRQSVPMIGAFHVSLQSGWYSAQASFSK